LRNKERGDDVTASAMFDFPSVFTEAQLDYISRSVVESARKVCGGKLREVILYGSYARGDFEEWSDVDIMILLDADDAVCRKLGGELKNRLRDLDYHMNGLLSLIEEPYSRFERMKNHYPFYTNVLKEGVKLC
jgi:predicted nucleotidyltransferase